VKAEEQERENALLRATGGQGRREGNHSSLFFLHFTTVSAVVQAVALQSRRESWYKAGPKRDEQQRIRLIRMSRWKASGIHLLLSATIAGSVLIFMLALWYPWPLFEVAGGSGLILILIGVDVTVGPLITLIIFKSGKKGLKFDLAAIASLQLAALAYGVHAMYLARPVYLAFTIDRFEVVTAKDLDPEDLARVTRAEFKRVPLGRPRYVAAVLPSDLKERTKVLETSLVGKDLQLYPQYYVPYEQEVPNALKRAKAVSVLLERDPQIMRNHLESAKRSEQSVKFLPLRGVRTDAAVLLDASSGAPLDIVLVNPW
jgi:hypothetical protein